MGARSKSRRKSLRDLGVLALLLLPVGCLSPTLPLPPPSRPDVSPPDSSGLASIVGRVPGGTTAIAQNLNTGQLVGEQTPASGSYTLLLPAAAGDQLVIWYRDGLVDSASVQVSVPSVDSQLGPLGGASGSEN